MAIRGTLPRAELRQIIAATYNQVWWPSTDEVRFEGDHLPLSPADQDRAVLAAPDQAMQGLALVVGQSPCSYGLGHALLHCRYRSLVPTVEANPIKDPEATRRT
ncbi:hypothetical protein ACQPZZ_00115 [Microbispora sp. CA-135349]|uniref:hypothetical protein n=1 Tax=Microbispora sp. CA-135349 TaxID=3239953 RepID=UPI003D89EE9B